jgi:hypothetical protein
LSLKAYSVSATSLNAHVLERIGFGFQCPGFAFDARRMELAEKPGSGCTKPDV